MDEKRDEKKRDEVENLEIEVLNDSDLESVPGGHNEVNSMAASACCWGGGDGVT